LIEHCWLRFTSCLNKKSKMPSTKHDVVIVGGGTAGLVLAARLSENPDVHVLVLEAGQDQSTDSRVTTPALWPMLLGTDADWAYRTVPQVSACIAMTEWYDS
jgi:choline dehydrogenase-like flavoprotein